jgi:hypothetical protein
MHDTGSSRGLRGGSFNNNENNLRSSNRNNNNPTNENNNNGFRLASPKPGPAPGRTAMCRPDPPGVEQAPAAEPTMDYPIILRAGPRPGRRRREPGGGE